MTTTTNPVVLCEEDYKALSDLLNLSGSSGKPDEMTLAYELSRAIVIKDSAFPPNTIRIGSEVTVLDTAMNKEMKFQIVMPGKADMKTKKVSILTPMAAAIIGFREGDEVNWKMPSGMKHLKVVSVENAHKAAAQDPMED